MYLKKVKMFHHNVFIQKICKAKSVDYFMTENNKYFNTRSFNFIYKMKEGYKISGLLHFEPLFKAMGAESSHDV